MFKYMFEFNHKFTRQSYVRCFLKDIKRHSWKLWTLCILILITHARFRSAFGTQPNTDDETFCKNRSYSPISCHWTLSIPPGNKKNLKVFWCFQGVSKETSGMRWVNYFRKHFHQISDRVLDTPLGGYCYDTRQHSEAITQSWGMFRTQSNIDDGAVLRK